MFDRTKAGVLVVYVTQMEGRPTIEELYETIIGKIKAKMSLDEVRDAVMAMKKRGLLSVNYSKTKGKTFERYSTKDVRWANPPEIAHIKTILPKLLATKESEKILAEMEDVHEAGLRKSRLPDIRDYVKYRLKYRAVLPILGGEPSGSGLNKLRRINGEIWLPTPLWMRAALRPKLRMANVAVSKVQYLDIDDVFLKPKNITEIALPIAPTPGRPGTGLSKHEAIPIGETFEVEIAFPTRGFMTEKEFIAIVDGIRIGAKHKEYGKLKLLKATKI